MNAASCVILLLGLSAVISVVLMSVSARWRDAQARKHVEIGDLWEYIGESSRPELHRGVWEVVAPNVNTEAGADSWIMRRIDGRTLYMHHRTRADSWILCMRDGRPVRREKDVARACAGIGERDCP